ncbi:Cof-type HAD-IIB family hydrolase [Faecalicatena acetigenes]|uniref:Cof-type HAD-IIB family hydrolase n=1 Tax=Faecalicatena acetigenes TaxID=2981790 RepID=A0ABT2TAW0_9FIRM|nr:MULTISPECIES: Cof-type HAD-IIB family hydrolase [Lachnospiraceae]MCU6747012.1 Cof-type HAD-IIB family hydrolase [Faecalicatena acetigenes]SCH58486.1 Uncharacterized phosphatase YwpJ [uncultured Clostridium sp.]
MIKVIASDLDGTLLNEEHKIAERTIRAVKRAQEEGILFVAATGRGYEEAKLALEPAGIRCSQIVTSGSEVRDAAGNIIRTISMEKEAAGKILEISEKAGIAAYVFTDELDGVIGTPEEVEDFLVAQVQTFHLNGTKEEILKDPLFQEYKKNTNVLSDKEAILNSECIIYKIFLFSTNLEIIRKIKKEVEKIPGIASAASSLDNVEITSIKAQKGPVLKWYVESLGYSMDEVMVMGDSLNDYSMLSMEFGACVAMENAADILKKTAAYRAPSNEEDGAAIAIEKLLEGKLEELRVKG